MHHIKWWLRLLCGRTCELRNAMTLNRTGFRWLLHVLEEPGRSLMRGFRHDSCLCLVTVVSYMSCKQADGENLAVDNRHYLFDSAMRVNRIIKGPRAEVFLS
jgi:hypothetical protein